MALEATDRIGWISDENIKCAVFNALFYILFKSVAKYNFSFTCDYSLHKLIKLNMEQFALFDVNEEFAEGVTISGKIRADQFDAFAAKLLDLSNGRLILLPTPSQ